MTGLTIHAADRVRGRCAGEGVDIDARLQPIINRITAGEGRGESVAYRIARLTRAVGDIATSNGNEVWAIVRDGWLTTVMFRRSDQPATAGALRVDRIEELVK